MKIRVVVIGRLKESYWIEAERELVKRLRPYCTLTIVEAKDEEGLLAQVPEGGRLYVFDERGPAWSSQEFAQNVLAAGELHGGGATLVFAIGGADGHSDAVRARAHQMLSFGRMTIAHRMVRLLVLEQIYRGFRIVRGEPYHRD